MEKNAADHIRFQWISSERPVMSAATSAT